MAHYDIPTPNTLLFRMLPAEHAAAALLLLDTFAPASPALPAPVTLCTLADVTSGPEAAPVAACAVAHDPGSQQAWVDRLVVAVPFRGRGLGRRLVADTATALRAKGVRRVFIRDPGDRLVRTLRRAGVICDAGPTGPWWDSSAPSEDDRAWSWLACDL